MAEQKNKKRLSQQQVRDLVENIEIRAESASRLVKGDPTEFIRPLEVQFVAGEEATKGEPREIKIGQARVLYIHGNLAYYNYRHALLDVCDAYSQELCELFNAFFEEENEWIEEVRDADVVCYDILYIDYVYLHPEYRGYGIGKILLAGLIEEFGLPADIVITWPLPMDPKLYEGKADFKLPYLTAEQTASATAKLRNSCEEVNFVPLESSQDFLFFSTGYTHKRVVDLLSNQKVRPIRQACR